MSILRAFDFKVLACIGVATVGFGAAMALMTALIITGSKPAFDQFHPDYAAFTAAFNQSDRALNAGQRPVVIDLAALNGGAWATACLFTGYTRPIEHMERLGAKVDQADRDRLTDARGGRLAPVEEREAVIAFMGEDRQAHFIHFQHGMGQYAEFTRNCVTKPETMLDVSAK